VRHSLKRKIATRLIKALGLTQIIRKLSPVASSLHFGENARDRLDEIRALLVVSPSTSQLVRMGDPADGGYVLQLPASSDVHLLSLGVGDNISFDLQLSKYMSSIHLYDNTVEALPTSSAKNMYFYRQGIAASSENGFISIEDCISKFPPNSDLILKMDIEGAEWEVLVSANVNLLARFQQIVIELHGIHNFREDSQFSKIVTSLKKLSTNHKIVNIHANNWGEFEIISNCATPDVLEVTYVRIDSLGINASNRSNAISPDLNKPCNPAAEDIVLSF